MPVLAVGLGRLDVSAVSDGVVAVLRVCAVGQVAQDVVGVVSVQVAYYCAIRARADERCEHEDVDPATDKPAASTQCDDGSALPVAS